MFHHVWLLSFRKLNFITFGYSDLATLNFITFGYSHSTAVNFITFGYSHFATLNLIVFGYSHFTTLNFIMIGYSYFTTLDFIMLLSFSNFTFHHIWFSHFATLDLITFGYFHFATVNFDCTLSGQITRSQASPWGFLPDQALQPVWGACCVSPGGGRGSAHRGHHLATPCHP